VRFSHILKYYVILIQNVTICFKNSKVYNESKLYFETFWVINTTQYESASIDCFTENNQPSKLITIVK